MSLRHMLSSMAVRTTLPDVDFNGGWINELESTMDLRVVDGIVTGVYTTKVGAPGDTEEFPLQGFASGDLITFIVNFGRYGSLTAWVGQMVKDRDKDRITTQWLLEKNVVDPDEPDNVWAATLSGGNEFTRRF